MLPNTAKIKNPMGSKLNNPKNRSRQLTISSLGAIPGQILAAIMIMSMKVTANITPGTNPAKKSRPIDSPTISPYRTRPMLGGIRMPRVPPAAKDPITNRSLYPRWRNEGRATLLIVAAVATLEPAQAANMAHEAMLLWIRPPGMNTSQRDRTLYIRSATPLRRTNSPIRMNSGIAIRMKLVLPSQALLPMMFHKLGLEILKNFMRMSAIAPNAPAT